MDDILQPYEIAAQADPTVPTSGGGDNEIQSTLKRMIQEAVQWYEESIEGDQADATDYYYGKPFGDEEEGRSQVVVTPVRDATLQQMPDLMRIFTGPERYVEFEPYGMEDMAQAQQATDYVRYVIMKDNPGYLILRGAFKDALVRRWGVIKWWWDKFARAQTVELENVGMDGLLILVQDPAVEMEITEITKDPEAGDLFKVRCTYRNTEGRARVGGVAAEEIVWSPNAKDFDSAPLVAHTREVPKDELLAMGIEESILDQHKGRRRSTSSSGLKSARRLDDTARVTSEDETDESQVPILYTEAYALVDVDGDGIAERRIFQCVGDGYEIVGEPDGILTDEVPFALFISDPEPHEINGLSNYDKLKDIQKIDSHILRGILDSLAKAIEPDEEVVMGQVNMGDVLSKERGRVIRTRSPGMMREIAHSFLGMDALSILGYTQEIKENRVGVSKAAAGLDPDTLQSSTKAAVAATITGGRRQLELLARDFAETGMKQLYRGILKMLHKHQPKKRMVRLRNEWVEIDPRSWNSDMDVVVNVALGQGTPEDKIYAMEKIIGGLGTLMQGGAPFVNWVNIRAAWSKAVEMAGFRNSEEFIGKWGPQEQQQYEQQQAQQPPPEDPNIMLVKVEQEKNQANAQMDQAKLQFENQKAQVEAAMKARQQQDSSQLAQEKLRIEEMVSREKAQLEAEKIAAGAFGDREKLAMQRMESEARVKLTEAQIELTKAQTVQMGKSTTERSNDSE